MINYISHDIKASSDAKIIKLLIKHGNKGYGLYWRIIEEMAQQGGKLTLDYNVLGYTFRESAEVIKSIINDFGLFVIDAENKTFSSNRLSKEIYFINEKSQKAREKANKRWKNENDKNATALPQHNTGNSTAKQEQCISNAYNITQDKIVEDNKLSSISPSKNDGGECCSQPLLLPSPVAVNATTDKAKEENKSSKAEQLQLEVDFDFFWKIYPRKVSKKDSFKAYVKARKKASANDLLEALREVKAKEWRSKELQYVPQASTWLNQERWTDEVQEQKKIDPLDDLDLDSNPFEVSK